jgi:uncharacterized membrane protein YwaF
MREFLGLDGYQRPAEGYFSWQHLTFVTGLIVIMTILAVFLGRRDRRNPAHNNQVLKWAAILIDGLEIFKIVIFSIRGNDPWAFLHNLTLFLCSIQLITIPLAAFSTGRLREAALDFVCIFGLLGAVLGTYFAGNNYGTYPVMSIDNVVSGLTHCISGFCSLYILISGMGSMAKRDLPVTFGILGFFCVAAYIANIIDDCNYMFLSRGDGTPYDIVYNLVNGHPVLYPFSVVLLFVIYIVAYYFIYYKISKQVRKTEHCQG